MRGTRADPPRPLILSRELCSLNTAAVNLAVAAPRWRGGRLRLCFCGSVAAAVVVVGGGGGGTGGGEG